MIYQVILTFNIECNDSYQAIDAVVPKCMTKPIAICCEPVETDKDNDD